MTSISCRAILFDLDGTLIDSWKCVEYAWRTWCLKHNLDYADLVRRFNGARAIDIVRALQPTLDAEKEKSEIDMLEINYPEKISTILGALDLLRILPKWGIVTSGTHVVASHKLKKAEINIPDVLVTADLITEGKPHPQGYLKGASLLNIAPEECLVFEDAPAGIKAARAAGMNVIALATTHSPSDLSEANACINDYNKINITINRSQINISFNSL